MKKAIFIVNEWSKNGGLEIVTQNAAKAFEACGYHVIVYSASTEGADYTQGNLEAHYPCPRNRILKSFWHRFFKFRYLANILKKSVKENDAVVFGHVYLLPVLKHAVLPAKTLRWVWTHDKEAWGESAVFWKPYFDKLTCVISVSKYTAEQARAGGTTTKVCVVENSVDTSFYVPTKRPELIRREEILICSRMPVEFRYKGHERLFKALPIAEKILGRQLCIRVVGNGPGLPEARRLAAQLGISDRVIFTGYVDDDALLEAFQHCGVFCMPSTCEGFGLVYAEAESCARPVIVSTAGGAPETIISGVTGLSVDPLDVEGIAKALASILSQSSYADKLGRAGREFVVERFTCDRFIKNILAQIARDEDCMTEITKENVVRCA